MIELNPINHPICFTIPKRLTPYSAWHEHIPFAMFVVDLLRPKTIVELGTHYGDSYCAFCQAVKELKLDTYCYAIDTWKGDIHTGAYGPDVLADLRVHHDPLYNSFSNLIKSTFDGALQRFADGTIDLLHIDGTHIYEAVKHDFEAWFPKVSSQGVILFHDIYAQEGDIEDRSDYGVHKLWDEIAGQYLHFEFLHGYGLGVLAKSELPSKELLALFTAQTEDVKIIQRFFSQLGYHCTLRATEVADKRQLVKNLDEKTDQITKLLMELPELQRLRHIIDMQILDMFKRAIRRSYYLGLTGIRVILNQGWRSFWYKFKQWLKQWRAKRKRPKMKRKSRNLQRDESNIYKKLYESMLSAAIVKPSNEYVPLSKEDYKPADTSIKLIAFYLPQFHPIQENDLWWGRGFTEWTNVSKAIPEFLGHYQPRLPGELGYYDLRNIDVQKRQVELARKYGIFGFCYHYYWFEGKRLLERPLEQFLTHPELDLPFCLCWANDNWTRKWDGQENEILMKQSHSPEDDILFIQSIEKALCDKRYIRINGRPLLIIYNASLLPKPKSTIKRWKEYCAINGIGDLYLVMAQTYGINNAPQTFGFDAAVQFPPHNFGAPEITHEVQLLNPNFSGHIWDYLSIPEEQLYTTSTPPYELFYSVFPSWDNTPRLPGKGHIFHNSTPTAYKQWLHYTCTLAMEKEEKEKRLVFINAWNEWAEGAYLEPDHKYGYAYLQSTVDVLKTLDSSLLKKPDESNH